MAGASSGRESETRGVMQRGRVHAASAAAAEDRAQSDGLDDGSLAL